MPSFLSIDVGIKNLAFSIFNTDDNKIIQVNRLGVLDVSRSCTVDVKDTESLLTSTINLVKDTFPEPFDYVIIENQPALKNPSMKTMQVTLYTLFLLRKTQEPHDIKHVVLYSASNKLKTSKMIPPEVLQDIMNNDNIARTNNAYNKRKKLSLAICKHFIDNGKIVMATESACSIYKNSKYADISDTLLQGLHFVSAL